MKIYVKICPREKTDNGISDQDYLRPIKRFSQTMTGRGGGKVPHTKTKTAANSLITAMTLILFEIPSSLHQCTCKAGLDSSKTGSHVRPGEKCHLDLDFAPSPSKMKLFPRRLCWTLDMSRGDSFTRRVPHMQGRSL